MSRLLGDSVYYSREYRKTIQAFLQRLVPSVSNSDDEDDCTDLVLKIWSRKATKRCYKETATDNNDMEIISEQLRDDVDDYCNALFTIDKKPVLQDCLDIPTYGKVCVLSNHNIFIAIF